MQGLCILLADDSMHTMHAGSGVSAICFNLSINILVKIERRQRGIPKKDQKRSLSKETLKWTKEMDKPENREPLTCVHCGKDLEDEIVQSNGSSLIEKILFHAIAFLKGGDGKRDNTFRACKTCAESKGTKPPLK